MNYIILRYGKIQRGQLKHDLYKIRTVSLKAYC